VRPADDAEAVFPDAVAVVLAESAPEAGVAVADDELEYVQVVPDSVGLVAESAARVEESGLLEAGGDGDRLV